MSIDKKIQKIESLVNSASSKPVDTESYFWYFLGRLRNCFELIGEGRLNFICLELDGNLIDENRFDRLTEIIFDEFLNQYEVVQFYIEGIAGKKSGYIVLADSMSLIEEAKEVFKIEDPEEFYYGLKALEGGVTACNLSMIRREIERHVVVYVDKPMGSIHPRFGWNYPINCGYVRHACTIYGDDLTAYIIGIDRPVDIFSGKVIAVVYRQEDKSYRLVVAPDGMDFNDSEIAKALEFDVRDSKYEILR